MMSSGQGATETMEKGNVTVVQLVEDVRSSNKAILQKLNDAVSNCGCLCECHSQQHKKDYVDLQSVVETLELGSKKKDEEIRQLHVQLKTLWDIVRELEKAGNKSVELSRNLPVTSKEQIKPSSSVYRTPADEDSSPGSKAAAVPPTIQEADPGSKLDGVEIKLVGGAEKPEEVTDTQVTASDYLNTVSATRTPVNGYQTNSIQKQITEPNFKLSGSAMSTASHTVEVIQQPTKRSFVDIDSWLQMASAELEAGRTTDLQHLGGAKTVILLDVSASMMDGDAWAQATKFCTDYLNGLEKMYGESSTQEYVALVTFGHECRVVSRFTNKMADLIRHLEMLKVGGPSPLFGGLYLSLGTAGIPHKNGFVLHNGIRVVTKILVLTDGSLTSTCLYEGPDVEDYSDLDLTMAHICQVMEKIQTSSVDLFFIPVGNCKTEFFEQMKVIGDCKILRYQDGLRTSRRLYIASQLQTSDLLIGMELPGMPRTQFTSPGDQDLAEEIKRESHKRMFDDFVRDRDYYKESTDPLLPPVGTRVRRGPDWTWKNQDNNGPGTVVGHGANELWVRWDINENVNVYQYCQEKYDVLPVDEPRIICDTDKLQVGCVVKPGRNWKGDADVKMTDRGVVIKSADHRVHVRWGNKKRGDYVHHVRGEQEVVYCAPDAHLWPSQRGYKLGDGKPVKKNKNKNS